MTAQLGRILFLTRGKRVPSARFRVEAYLPALRAAGWDCEVEPLRPAGNSTPPNWLRRVCLGSERLTWRTWLALQALNRLKLYWRVRRCDILFLQKDLTPWPNAWIEKLLIKSARKGSVRLIILDVDDAIWQLYPQPESPQNKVNQIARVVDLVLAGNKYSADHFKQFAKRVEIIPTAIDTESYEIRDPSKMDPNLLVWIGSSGGYTELEVLKRPFKELREELPNLRLRLVSDKPPPVTLCSRNSAGNYQLGNVPVDYIPWSKQVEVEALEDAALGLMPLQDTPWNRGKCGFKLLLYLARGVPAMGSALPVNVEILRDPKMVVSDDQDWKDKVYHYCIENDSSNKINIISFPAPFSCREVERRLIKILGEN